VSLTADIQNLLKEALESSSPILKNPPSFGGVGQNHETDSLQDSSVSYLPLAFENAAEFLLTFDPALKSGKKSLYKWQIEELIRLSKTHEYRTEAPFEYMLCAANGSGKDAYIIAGFVCFVLCCRKRYKVVITSSSDLQLDSQTRNYIKYLAENVNAYLKANGIMEEAIDIKKESFKSKVVDSGQRKVSLTGSEVITFVTKEGGRAEGHHPFPDAEVGEGVILIANECKTVPQEIFEHFAKCTYNMFIKVSSAGPKRGDFYDSCESAVRYPREYIKDRGYLRVVTAYDCPHIAKSKLDREVELYGVDDPWFKNTRLSQFTSVGEQVVITEEILKKQIAKKIGRISAGLGRRAGLDLAGGGDENSLTVIEENEVIALEHWRAKDTELTVDLLCGTDGEMGLFQKYNLVPERIFADDGGVGQAMLDGLARRKWPVIRTLNQSAALNTLRYLNRGAELWFIFARLLQAGYIHFAEGIMSDELLHQLTNRHYEQDPRLGKLKLWSKAEEKLEGNHSPDLADSLVLAFTGTSIFDFTESKKAKEKPKTPGSMITTETILRTNSADYRAYQRLGIKRENKGSIIYSNPIALMQSLYD